MQARTLSEVEPMARDLIAIMDDIPADSFSLDVTITLPADVQEELERSAELRQDAARRAAAAAEQLTPPATCPVAACARLAGHASRN